LRRLRTKERRRKRALRPNWWLRLILYRPARLDTQVVGPAAAYPRHVTYDTAMSRRITSVWTRCPQLVLLGAFPCNLARWKNVSRAFFLAGFALIQPLRQQHNIDAVGGGATGRELGRMAAPALGRDQHGAHYDVDCRPRALCPREFCSEFGQTADNKGIRPSRHNGSLLMPNSLGTSALNLCAPSHPRQMRRGSSFPGAFRPLRGFWQYSLQRAAPQLLEQSQIK
jgi:hypothetical protein